MIISNSSKVYKGIVFIIVYTLYYQLYIYFLIYLKVIYL